jgi:carboxypeptidase PM20D1
MWKKALLGIVLFFGTLLFAVVVRAILAPSAQVPATLLENPVEVGPAAERLGAALRLPTISYQDPTRLDANAFGAFHALLEREFPKAHEVLEKKAFNEFALLYTWKGKDEGAPALVLMAHSDVVPVVNAEGWSRPPFSGALEDGAIWGRGALDDKGPLMAILEAVEILAAREFTPERTLYLAFGHDEEIGGQKGAVAIAAHLAESGAKIGAVLDEGMAVTEGQVPFREGPVAVIGLAEKGYVSLELQVESAGGHSSMPPKKSALGELATAIHRLEENQMPARLEGPPRQLLTALGAEIGYPGRWALTNLWLFGPIIKAVLLKQSPSAALVRTTTAATMAKGSEKENVLPQSATAVVNFRILPGDTVEEVKAHVEKTVNNHRITIRIMDHAMNPSPISTTDSHAYRAMSRSIREVFAGVVVVPGLVLGATDSRHFAGLTPHIYRFAPMRFSSEDKGRVHGRDERVKVANYREMIFWYQRFIENFGVVE